MYKMKSVFRIILLEKVLPNNPILFRFYSMVKIFFYFNWLKERNRGIRGSLFTEKGRLFVKMTILYLITFYIQLVIFYFFSWPGYC
ncbi:MAG: hypothetical protein CSA22_02650 [Deltaproteobacteria bacterium]|nr:MAG: hypothetical protein CSA22_02650 [Deltaproteobacteria bacterium]